MTLIAMTIPQALPTSFGELYMLALAQQPCDINPGGEHVFSLVPRENAPANYPYEALECRHCDLIIIRKKEAKS